VISQVLRHIERGDHVAHVITRVGWIRVGCFNEPVTLANPLVDERIGFLDVVVVVIAGCHRIQTTGKDEGFILACACYALREGKLPFQVTQLWVERNEFAGN
jgi:hypothetical protein